MPVKVILGYTFNDTGPKRPGWSEVHFYLGSVTTTADIALNLAVVQLMNARTQLMGNNVRASMYRLSVPGVPRKSTTVYAVPNASGQSAINQYPSLSQGSADIPNACVMGTLKSAANQARAIYLAGLPDVLIRTGTPVGPDFGAAGLQGYQALWLTWQTLLLNGQWGFLALNLLPNGQPAPISYWQQATAAPFNIQFVLPNNAAYIPVVGAIVHVRGVLMGVTGAERPIGRWRIKSTTAVDANNTAFELDKSSAFQAVLVDRPGTVESVQSSYVAYDRLTNLLQTTRRRGIGPVRPRGRSRPRVRRQAS
jgi:hypothetical protein